MRPYGVKLGISLNFSSPRGFGGLDTFDPVDPAVIAFWGNVTERIYHAVPDMAGYLVKANSEGQPGPLTYNRTLAVGANLFANAVKPHGGIVMFRAFVYDNHINESNWKNDRANAAVDFFKDLDGKFDDNVVVQIKYGPIDFQVREPPRLFSPTYSRQTQLLSSKSPRSILVSRTISSISHLYGRPSSTLTCVWRASHPRCKTSSRANASSDLLVGMRVLSTWAPTPPGWEVI